MNLTDRAKADWLRFSSDSDSGFGVAISFIAPTAETATINGLGTKHRVSIDSDGQTINAKNVHVTFAESLLVAESYPVRNGAGEVSLRRHRVSFADSTGLQKNYVILETFPDETVGMITCILGDYE